MKTGNCDCAEGSVCSTVGSAVSRTQRPVSKLTALHVLFLWQTSMQSVRCRTPGIDIIDSDGLVNTWPVSNSKVRTPSEQSIDQTIEREFNFSLQNTDSISSIFLGNIPFLTHSEEELWKESLRTDCRVESIYSSNNYLTLNILVSGNKVIHISILIAEK